MDISVIIPTLNEEKSIEPCLKAIKSQETRAEYEIIVSDCKSEDGTVKIAKKYADKVVFSERRSIGIARNTGANFSEGRYLVFIDADTLIPKNYLEKVIEKFESDPELLAFSAAFTFATDDKRIKIVEKFTNSYLVFRDKIGLTVLPGFNICVRRDIFNTLNGFRDVPLEDGEFAVRLRKMGKTRYFTDFYVITSSRRLDEMGLLGTLRYYFEMDLAMREPALKKFLTYNSYIPLRLNENSLYREFERIYNAKYSAGIDLTISEYLQRKTNELIKIMDKTDELKNLTIEQFTEKMRNILRLIVELKLEPSIIREDMERAIGMIIHRNREVRRKRNGKVN